MTIDSRIQALVREYSGAHAQEVAFQAENAYYDMAANCESPIERLLLAPLMFIKPQCLHGRYEGPADREIEGRLFAQYRVGERRLDFAYIVTPIAQPWEIRLGIECDGHEFHSSVAQRANDNRRHIEIVRAEGFNVVRFSGSEINADPRGCAQKVADTVDDIYANHVFASVNRTVGKPYVGPVGPLLSEIANKAGEP